MLGVCDSHPRMFSVGVVIQQTWDVDVIYGTGNVPPLFHCFDEYLLRSIVFRAYI